MESPQHMVMEELVPDAVICQCCNTQIEKALLRAWTGHYPNSTQASTTRTSSAKLCLRFQSQHFTDRVFPQYRIGRFHADFMFVRARNGHRTPYVLVECDGYDYHERTKAQAEHDRRRDRQLQALGYPVLRFLGGEIWRDASSCATEIDAALQRMLEVWRA